MLKQLLATNSGITPLMLRLTAAIVIWPHGAQKLLGWFGGYGYTGSMNYFISQGLPYIIGFLVIFLEFFGALLLLFGLGTRLVAAAMVLLFMGMIFTVHFPVGFFMNWFGTQKGEGYEYHILFIGISLALAINGGGAWSADKKISENI